METRGAARPGERERRNAFLESEHRARRGLEPPLSLSLAQARLSAAAVPSLRRIDHICAANCGARRIAAHAPVPGRAAF